MRHGGGDAGGVGDGEQAQRVARADPIHVGQQTEEAEVVGLGEAVEGHLVFANHEVRVDEDLASQGAQSVEGPCGREDPVADAAGGDHGGVGVR